MGYMIHRPIATDDTMHEWCLEFLWDDHTTSFLDRYGTETEAIEEAFWSLDNFSDMIRVSLWRDLIWWGEVER